MKKLFVLLSIACMLLLLGLAGGSDAGNITPGQALWGGTLAMAGCMGCAWGANRVGERR